MSAERARKRAESLWMAQQARAFRRMPPPELWCGDNPHAGECPCDECTRDKRNYLAGMAKVQRERRKREDL